VWTNAPDTSFTNGHLESARPDGSGLRRLTTEPAGARHRRVDLAGRPPGALGARSRRPGSRVAGVWQGGAVPTDIDDSTLRTADIRAARHRAVSERLAALDDDELGALLADGAPATVGFGGTTSTVDVGGVPVFVKRVPLTDLERRPENVGSTANIFRLPLFYQYGIGSAGFGAWREVAMHTMTTQWVLDGRYHGFPLLYHWRVLPQPPQPADVGELDRWVAHWDGDDAVRARLEAIGTASAAVVLFMEHLPHTVNAWLTEQTAAGGAAAEAAYTLVDRALRDGVEFMRGQGFIHFDAHFLNLLTDGRHVYFADFGLAVHAGFDLDAAETAFFRRHQRYDQGYTAAHLTQWLLSNLLNLPWRESLGYLREHGPDLAGRGLPDAAARIIARDAPVAMVLDDFFGALMSTKKGTAFPADDLDRAVQVTGGG